MNPRSISFYLGPDPVSLKNKYSAAIGYERVSQGGPLLERANRDYYSRLALDEQTTPNKPKPSKTTKPKNLNAAATYIILKIEGGLDISVDLEKVM